MAVTTGVVSALHRDIDVNSGGSLTGCQSRGVGIATNALHMARELMHEQAIRPRRQESFGP